MPAELQRVGFEVARQRPCAVGAGGGQVAGNAVLDVEQDREGLVHHRVTIDQ